MRRNDLWKNGRRVIGGLLAGAMLLTVCACGGEESRLSDGTVDLTADVTPSSKALAFAKDDEQAQVFRWQYQDFALTVFKECVRKDGSETNTLVSPLSVMTALAMTANGAQGDTLAQMEWTLGGDLIALDAFRPLDTEGLNQYLGAYLGDLPNDKKARLCSANSIWVKDGVLDVKPTFLQTNADHYNAQVFAAAFDSRTKEDVNRWVSDKTNGMIPQMLDEIPVASVMYLINALAFDAEWKEIYRADQVFEAEFTDINGKTANVPMMGSEESGYLDDGSATGFIKPYASGYSFVAMVPNEGVSLDDYVQSMRYDKILAQITESNDEPVMVSMPKFSADYSVEMSDILRDMGINDAFEPDRADFSAMAEVREGELYINRVLHKAAIQVDERGTKAGAATAVEMRTKGALLNSVYLNRPFVYMIVDNENHLPVFIGRITHV